MNNVHDIVLPTAIWASLITGLFTVLVGIIAFLLSERTRRIDLYKSVYPEKFKAAREYIEQANTRRTHYYVCARNYSHLVMAGHENRVESDLLFRSAQGMVWLFGDEFVRIAEAFHNAGMATLDACAQRKSPQEIEQSLADMEKRFAEIHHFFRRNLHIKEFERLFPW